MGDDGQCGNNPQMHIGQKCGGDNHAIHKIMERVADHDHHAATAMHVWFMRLMHFAMVVVAVPPQQQFFQRKKQQDAEQYGAAERRPIGRKLDRFGQDVEKHGAQQRADRIADQRIHPVRTRVQCKQRGKKDAQCATENTGSDYPQQNGHEVHSQIQGRGL